MENKVHTFSVNIDWELIRLISQIDRFDASWTSIEKKEGQSLKQLKTIATVQSVGASTRIEGSKMSDEEVEVLLKEIDIKKIVDRDSQEVVGYFETLDLISESYEDIPISESSLKNLHNILMKYSKKDEWHKGDYKQHSNAVEAKLPDGTRQIIFQTTYRGWISNSRCNEIAD
jgi:Fic family protein